MDRSVSKAYHYYRDIIDGSLAVFSLVGEWAEGGETHVEILLGMDHVWQSISM